MSQLNEDNSSNLMRLSASDIELPVFTESSAITIQPQTEGEFTGSRRPIPVSTINWRSTNLTQFTPMHGLDFLMGAEQVYIQQTVELNDLLSSVESENRYTVKVPQGETLYLASESSNSTQRLCFGSSRSFSMRLYDQTRQEAVNFVRRLAFTNCLCGCYLQELQVWIPPGQLIGIIKQDWTFLTPSFSVINSNQQVIYKIEGPTMCVCTSYKDAHFKDPIIEAQDASMDSIKRKSEQIYSGDGTTQLGSIHHQWDQLQVAYNLCLQFPNRNSSSKEKALLLGAAFLLEYLYFESVKNRLRCCC